MVALANPNVAGRRDRGRVPRIEGIRGLCALSVLVTHVAFVSGVMGSYQQKPGNRLGAILADGLTVGLGPFFVMSGFFLYRPFARRTLAGTPAPDLRTYFRRRTLRIMPAFWLLVLFCLLFIVRDQIHGGIWFVVRPVVLMQSYDFHFYAGLDPTWTVPAEMQFYLALPLIAWLMHLLARRKTDPWQQARRMLIPIAAMLLVGLVWTSYIHRASMGIFPAQYWWPFSQLGLFGLGMGLAIVSVIAQVQPERVPALHRIVTRWPNWCWAAALALYAINAAQPLGRSGYGDYENEHFGIIRYFLSLGFSLLIVAPLVTPNASSRFMEALLSNPPVRYLGRISYGIYLWHFAVIYLWFNNGSMFGSTALPVPAFRGVDSFPKLMTAVTVGSVIAATLSYYLLERPLMSWAERRAKHRRDLELATPATITRPKDGRPPRRVS